MSPPPGATYESTAGFFRVSVPAPGAQRWLTTPLVLIWIAIAAYAFVIAPRRPDLAASESIIIGAFAALVGIPLVASVVFYRFGRLTVFSDGNTGRVREHIGSIGTAQEFAWSALASVAEVDFKSGRQRYKAIEFDLSAARSNRRIYAGRGLSDEFRKFLLSVLETEIANNRRSHPLGLEG
jgi:hypothetical protein